MQKTPSYHSSRTASTLMAVAATMPFAISSASADEGYSGMSGLAQREIIRRQEAVAEADRLFLEGREAYAKADFQKAVDMYSQAIGKLPLSAPTLSDRRASYTEHLADASVALAQQFRKVGKYDEARKLLEDVLSPNLDPGNVSARAELGYLDDPIRTNPALTYEHTKNIDEVRRSLYMAQGNYDLGKFDAAKVNYEAVLRIDRHNKAARRGMEKITAAKSDYYRAAYDHTRAEMLMQVDEAWELSVPADLPEFDLTPSRPGSSDGVAYITEKIRRIIIPSINFEEGIPLEEAIDFLRQRAVELDTLELDPDRKGVNIIIQRPRTGGLGGLGGNELDLALGVLGGGDIGGLRFENALRIRNVPLATALKLVGDQVKLRYKVDDFAVTFVPQTDTNEELFTRTFRVPPDFASSIGSRVEGDAPEVDPFAPDAAGAGLLKPRPPIIELLRQSGIVFGPNSSATLSANGALLITNTPSELDKVEQLIEASSDTPKQVKITTKFVEIRQTNSDELGFDWIISPFGLSANNVFGMAGTLGNGPTKTSSDFISPVNGILIDGIPAGGGAQVQNIVTGGLRSGDTAISGNSIDAILNNPSRSAQSSNLAPGILGLTGFFADSQMQVIMRGLAQKKGTDLMTAPSVTAKSGMKASIEVIREFIYPTEYEAPELPAQNNNQGGFLGGGGGGGGGNFATPSTPTAFETKNLGVTLEIEPTIGQNNFVIDLRFIPEIVEFEGFINFGSPILSPGTDILGNPVTAVITENRIEMPVFSRRSVSTDLTIYDGYTVAVGGLMREDIQTVEDKVPILGDIPLIGRLFQSQAENRIKSNLIIFVTAQIIDATGRPLRGGEASSVVPVTPPVGEFDGGVLPVPLDLPE